MHYVWMWIQACVYVRFWKGQGHQGIFSLVKESLYEEFVNIYCSISGAPRQRPGGHGGNHEVSGLWKIICPFSAFYTFIPFPFHVKTTKLCTCFSQNIMIFFRKGWARSWWGPQWETSFNFFLTLAQHEKAVMMLP